VTKALRQAALAIAILAAVALALSTGVVGSTSALFNGETQNAGSVFAGGWVDAPSTLTATPSGYDVNLAWTPGVHSVTGQKVNGVDNVGVASCTGAAWTPIATLGSATTAAYPDPSRGTAANNGNWFCYQLQSTSATAWTAETTKAVQLGLVANGLSTVNAASKCSGGSTPTPVTGKTDCNDKIVITFNQKPILPASPIRVCMWASGTIVIADTLLCLASTDGYGVAKLTGGTLGTNVAYSSSPYTLSTVAPWTMTITLAGSTTTSTVSGTWTLTPAAGILSAVTTHQATICSAAKPTCQPTSSTTF
jgi:hypothetical protein